MQFFNKVKLDTVRKLHKRITNLMSEQDRIFIFESAEIQELLADNQLDIVDLLKHEGVDVNGGYSRNPVTPENSRYKDPTTVIFGTAAIILALTPIVSKLLAALSRRGIIVREVICVPVEDSNGNVIRDGSGEPILQWVERSRFLSNSDSNHSNSQISLKAPLGIEILYEDDSSVGALPSDQQQS